MSWSWPVRPSRASTTKMTTIGLGHGLLCLLGHFLVDTAAGVRLEATGIDDDVLLFAQLAVAVMPVTRQTGEVSHDRITRLRQAVEQR